MRKYHQQLVLDLLQTIREAQDSDLFEDCQDGISFCYDFIVENNYEDSKTAALMSEYYEMVFKVHTSEADKSELVNLLQDIENSVREELKPNRIEAVFISYKASMSDCIESIYLAAKEDPNCDAYWIPIPYINRDTPNEPIYEGLGCYSSNIECTDYHDYDIEARHPDVIITFNPYDNNNTVTCIHPGYFCEKLHKLTDYFCYMPYGTSGKNIVKYEAFCVQPGSIYANKVFIESDFVRDFYVKSYKKIIGDDRFGKAEDKFITIGSPKYDKVLNARKEDYKLPDEWLDLIHGKKVVLYNVSVASVICKEFSTEQFVEKIRTVVETFMQRDDVLLWWRPHPMIETTLRTMRESLAPGYLQIIEDFKRSSKGIFDDTTDLHRSIVWSDIHYGDENSVMRLYEVTGKPVIVQDYCAKSNPWSSEDDLKTNPLTETERPPCDLNELAVNLDGTCGQKIWDYVVKELQKL